MAVLLEEVVLDQPEGVDADLVQVLALLHCLIEDPLLVSVGPGLRDLVLVERAELHGSRSTIRIILMSNRRAFAAEEQE